jgi:hypothetical protein
MSFAVPATCRAEDVLAFGAQRIAGSEGIEQSSLLLMAPIAFMAELS